MPLLTERILASNRLEVLADTIIWGNAHYQPRRGLAVTSNGKAYTLKNLQYATALLEAVAEMRDVQLSEKSAADRANQILGRLLKRMKPAKARRGSAFDIPQFDGAGSPWLSDEKVKVEVLGILVCLNYPRGRLKISPATSELCKRALAAIVKRHAAIDREAKQGAKPTTKPASRPNTSELQLLSQLKARVAAGYHWSQSLQQFEVVDLPEHLPPEWPIPCSECALQDCAEVRCCIPPVVAPPPGNPPCTPWSMGGTPSIKVRFFKGDWKDPQGNPSYPVILVGGWQVQISSSHPSGPGFTEESSWSTRPPQYVPAPGEGNCRLAPAPIIQFEPSVSPYRDFYGLANMLRCGAGYSHVRFSMSHPSDDIQIAADELYAVVNKTKELYNVDKVILVCHSRGGIVARRYIVDRWKRECVVDVAKLITYATPHLGAELGETAKEIIASLPFALLDVTNPVLAAWHVAFASQLFNLLGQVPGVGQQIEDAILDLIIGVIVEGAEIISPQLAEFFESGDQLRPTSPFLAKLNDEYNDPVIPMEDRMANLWQAIDHVLIAGTTPTYFTLYLGSWVPDIRPEHIALSAAQQLVPGVCWKKVKIGPLKMKVPYPAYKWNWTWHPILDVIGSLAPYIPELAELPEFTEGQGDSVVEKTSAHAQGVVGKIRRTEFKLQHFAIKANHEQYSLHEPPSGPTVLVNPFQLLFIELGVPYAQVSKCPFAEGECEGFNINKAR